MTCARPAGAVLGFIVCFVTVQIACVESATLIPSSAPGGLWAHDNLVAWGVVPFDARQREPEERAQMLEKLGFKNFAYSWREKHIPTFDAEIEALQRHRIHLLAWALYGSENPNTQTILETCKRHHIHPQLWVMQSPAGMPKTPEEWAKRLPNGFHIPTTSEELSKLSPEEKQELKQAQSRVLREDLTETQEEQQQRVKKEADRINALVKRAAPYGIKVELYNHNAWFGMEENQLAIIARLKELGVTDVGMVYNFSHARDALHDDSKMFPPLWEKMRAHVVAVNITGMRMDGDIIYPSQGDSELAMMRTIQESGWRGPIGVMAEMGGDAEVTLRNYLTGLDWLAAELKQPGSGGPRPFPPTP
jgi:hypothetical protein